MQRRHIISYLLKRLSKPQIDSARLISGSYLTSLHGDRFFTLSLELNCVITLQLVIQSLETPKRKNKAHLAIFRFYGSRFFSGVPAATLR